MRHVCAMGLVMLGACTAELGSSSDANTAAPDPKELGTDEISPSQQLELPVEELIGATIEKPRDGLVLRREGYELEGSLGFTLWDPGEDPSDPHSGGAAIRVALAHEMTADDIEAKVEQRLEEYEGTTRKTVSVDGYDGIAVGPVPGAPASTEIWVPAGTDVYRVNVYRDELDEEARRMLANVELGGRHEDIGALGLLAANDPELLYIDGGGAHDELLRVTNRALPELATQAEEGKATAGLSYERRIAEGCWEPPSRFWAQTQHGWGANGTGWVRVGVPNYWGEYTHGSLGYGRCASPYYTNDKFAVDYPMRRGDVIFSPFRRATVMFAGRTVSHANYGIMVVLRAANGKYWNLSGHLNGLARGIRRGATVTNNSIIGYAGNTGHPSIPVGPVHLHSVFYRYPNYNSYGAPFGGAGLGVSRFHYVGTAAGNGGGVYQFVWPGRNTAATVSKGEWISN